MDHLKLLAVIIDQPTIARLQVTHGTIKYLPQEQMCSCPVCNRQLTTMSHTMLVCIRFGMGLLAFTVSVTCLSGNKDLNHTSLYQFLGSAGMIFPTTAGLSPSAILREVCSCDNFHLHPWQAIHPPWTASMFHGLNKQTGTQSISLFLWVALVLSYISPPLMASILICHQEVSLHTGCWCIHIFWPSYQIYII